MKKNQFLLVLAATLAMFALSISVQAQNNWFVRMHETSANNNDFDSVTAGRIIMYYVEPDGVLNDAFVGNAIYDTSFTNAANGLQSTWNWRLGVSSVGDTKTQFPVATQNGPSVKYVFNAPDVDTVFVYEQSKSGCIGDTSFQIVKVFAAPSFNVSSNPVTDTIYLCQQGATVNNQTIDLSGITDNNVYGGVGTTNNHKFRFDYIVRNLDADYSIAGNVDVRPDTIVDLVYDFAGTATLFTQPVPVRNAKITEYEFAFTPAAGGGYKTGAVNGISDHVSRKSDFFYLADETGATESQYTYYPALGATDKENTIVVRVLPAPVTGPIYFIPNNFND